MFDGLYMMFRYLLDELYMMFRYLSNNFQMMFTSLYLTLIHKCRFYGNIIVFEYEDTEIYVYIWSLRTVAQGQSAINNHNNIGTPSSWTLSPIIVNAWSWHTR